MKGRSALPRFAFFLGLVILAAAVSSPIWGRAMLKRVDYFDARRVEVMGSHWAAPDGVLRLAAIGNGRSVWDDYSDVERQLLRHPLIEEARVHRSGFHTLRIVIREVEPAALVAVPELRVVRADGTVLPIDPVGKALDLPVLMESAELADDSTRLQEGPALDALEIFSTLKALDPGLAAVVSDFGLLNEHELMAVLELSQPAYQLALPGEIDENLLRRVRATLADLRARGIDAELVEARFAEMIVVRRKDS